jgi:hypothetical protein
MHHHAVVQEACFGEASVDKPLGSKVAERRYQARTIPVLFQKFSFTLLVVLVRLGTLRVGVNGVTTTGMPNCCRLWTGPRGTARGNLPRFGGVEAPPAEGVVTGGAGVEGGGTAGRLAGRLERHVLLCFLGESGEGYESRGRGLQAGQRQGATRHRYFVELTPQSGRHVIQGGLA